MKCRFCEFVKASARERLHFLKEIIWGRESVVILVCGVLSLFVYFATVRVDQVGCSLVVMALVVAGWNRFNEGFRRSQQRLNQQTIKADNAATNFIKQSVVGQMYKMEGGVSKPATIAELDETMNKKHVGMTTKTDDIFNSKQYHIAEFVLAIIGTILWGFG